MLNENLTKMIKLVLIIEVQKYKYRNSLQTVYFTQIWNLELITTRYIETRFVA